MTEAAPRVTIADVARTAGVSVPTVSKVLNDRADVSPATRSRVQRSLAAHGYRRRSERRAPAKLVDLVLSDLNSPYFLEVIDGAERAAARAGMGLVVTAIHGKTARGTRGDGTGWLDTLAARPSAGMVLVVFATLEHLGELQTPLVLLDPIGGSDPRLPTVGATNWSGGLAATEHLLSLGHHRIAAITGDPRLVCSQERLEGYRAAMGRAGVPVDEELVRFGDFEPSSGQRSAAELLALPDPPTAVFAGSDMQASGIYQEARAHGLRVPDDLSVVGFDDLSISRYLSPPLTTVRQPVAHMAAEAVRLALETTQHDPAATPPRLELATSLTVRDSTAPPRR